MNNNVRSWLGVALSVAAAAGAPVPAHAQLAPSDTYAVRPVARTGSNGILGIEPDLSVNNNGVVAFIGRVFDPVAGQADNLFAASLTGIANVTPGLDASNFRELRPSVQLNDRGEALIRRFEQISTPFGLDPITVIERRNVFNRVSTTLVTGELFFGDFDGLYAYPSINNVDGIVFSALDGSQNKVGTLTSAGGFVVNLNGPPPFPMISDTNEFSITLGTDRVAILPPAFFPFTATVADSARGFSNVGQRAGISDDGHAVTLTATQGGRAGIFLSIRTGGAFPTAFRIAGIAEDGWLDPGEVWEDDGDGVVQPGEDRGLISGFPDTHTRVTVQRTGALPLEYTVCFQARDLLDRNTVYTARVRQESDVWVVKPLSQVVGVGQVIEDVGAITALSLFDAINTRGQVAVRVAAGSVQAVLLCDPAGAAEFVDLNDPQVTDSPVFPPSAAWLFGELPNTQVVGLAADGTTRILLRTLETSTPGRVRITVRDESGSTDAVRVGRLTPLSAWSTIEESPGTNQNPVVLDLVGRGDAYRAFAVLEAPADFVRFGTAFEAEDKARTFWNPPLLTVDVEPVDASGNPTGPPVRQTLRLTRPPVVLMHGLFDCNESFRWPLATDPRFFVYRGDYRNTNGRPYGENIPNIRAEVGRALTSMRSLGIAVTKVDYFGHSMGGVLARGYSNDVYNGSQTLYLRRDNFFQGDFNRLVTVNSPHRGSQMATNFVDAQGNAGVVGRWVGQLSRLCSDPGSLICQAVINDGLACNGCPGSQSGLVEEGASLDLRPDGPGTRLINEVIPQRPPRVHAMCGRFVYPKLGGDQHWLECRTRLVLQWFCEGQWEEPDAFFFGGNDGVVSVDSQLAGLPLDDGSRSGPSTLIEGAPQGLHWPTIGETEYATHGSEIAIDLLNSPINGPRFADGFPSMPPVPFTDACNIVPSDYDPCVLSPTGMTDIVPGSDLYVLLCDPPRGGVYEVLFATSWGTLIADETPPFEVAIPVPDTALGPLEVRAFVRQDGRGTNSFAAVSAVAVAPSPLTALRFEGDGTLLFDYAPSFNLRQYLRGTFSDGIERALVPGAVPIEFELSDPAAVDILPDWTVIGRHAGTTTLVARSGDQAASFAIEVRSTVPRCPADFNNDGTVNSTDVSDFINQWFQDQQAGTLIADWDGNGVVNSTDVSSFVNAWFEDTAGGCG